MREEQKTPSAMTCVCHGLLPCDRARAIGVITRTVHGTFFSSTTKIKVASLQ